MWGSAKNFRVDAFTPAQRCRLIGSDQRKIKRQKAKSKGQKWESEKPVASFELLIQRESSGQLLATESPSHRDGEGFGTGRGVFSTEECRCAGL
jgi:hypothetical protein